MFFAILGTYFRKKYTSNPQNAPPKISSNFFPKIKKNMKIWGKKGKKLSLDLFRKQKNSVLHPRYPFSGHIVLWQFLVILIAYSHFFININI